MLDLGSSLLRNFSSAVPTSSFLVMIQALLVCAARQRLGPSCRLGRTHHALEEWVCLTTCSVTNNSKKLSRILLIATKQGDPSEGYSDQEALKRYGEVAHAVPPDEYAQAAQDALSKLSPEERAEFLKTLQESRGVKLPGQVASDPKDLGQVLTDLHERDILGPAGGVLSEVLASPQAKAVLAGIS